jgi:Amt family ammonium transporter
MGMYRRRASLIVALFVASFVASTAAAETVGSAPGPAATAPAATPDLAARVADLEAYIANGTPKYLSSPGPGHNAWMMTSSALVLFMTLPGLALFYGGLVRRKNVLSVMAQCLGCAGLVTILWWAVGYSLAFDHGTPFLGGLHHAWLKG